MTSEQKPEIVQNLCWVQKSIAKSLCLSRAQLTSMKSQCLQSRQELSGGLSSARSALPIWKHCRLEPSLQCTLCNHLPLQGLRAEKVQNAGGLQHICTFFCTQAQEWVMNC